MPWKDLSIYINELEILVKENDLKGILNILKKLVIDSNLVQILLIEYLVKREKIF